MNYYDILGIKKDASLENIQKAKDKLKFGGPDDKAPFSMWAKIDEAYEVLSDREKRREYDEKLEEATIDYSTSKLQSEFASLQSMLKENKEKIVETEVKDDQLSKTSLISTQLENELSKEKNDHEQLEKIGIEGDQSVQTDLNNVPPEEEIFEAKKEQIEISDPNKYISEFQPVETERVKIEENLRSFGKNAIKYAGGALVGATLLGPAATIPGIIIGFAAVKVLDKTAFRIIKEEIKYRKISKISTEEMKITADYYKKLDDSINKLLSEPHNNYKLKVLELKYKNQTEFLEKLLEMKLNQKYRTRDLFKQKLDLVSTKMQLETAKANLKDINEQINNYENNQKKSKRPDFIKSTKQKIEDINENLENYENKKNVSDINRVFVGVTRKNLESISDKIEEHETMKNLSEMNKAIINVNHQISETDKNQKQSSDVKKLQVYKSRLLKERNIKASNLKNRLVRNRSVYDKFLKAKDFVVSLPYIIKSSEQVAEFIESGNQRLL